MLSREKAINMLNAYKEAMKLEELCSRTIAKYCADIMQWLREMPEEIGKEQIHSYKEKLCHRYKATSVNSKIISINRYLKWLKCEEITVKVKRIQKFNGLENVITKEYYIDMLDYAKKCNKLKMYYIMKVIAQTGIRIGELKFITVEAIKEGETYVYNKGKFRKIYLTKKLCKELERYCETNAIKKGIIFYGREKGMTITSGAVWKNLKYIAKQVGVPENLVYSHSFRHLFAKEYMKNIGDISELADLLGHSRLETTWIYTKTTSDEKRERLELLNL